jgi:hypothetical protein
MTKISYITILLWSPKARQGEESHAKIPQSDQKQEVEAPKEFESSIDPEKKETIEEIDFDDRTGYRSIRDTWKQAREIDPDIKLKDVSQ